MLVSVQDFVERERGSEEGGMVGWCKVSMCLTRGCGGFGWEIGVGGGKEGIDGAEGKGGREGVGMMGWDNGVEGKEFCCGAGWWVLDRLGCEILEECIT